MYTDVIMNMNVLEFVTRSTLKTFWEEKFTLGELTAANIKIVVFAMLGKNQRSRVVISTSPWTSHWSLAVWTR